MFGLENSFLSALGQKLDFLPWEVMQACWPTVGGGGANPNPKVLGWFFCNCGNGLVVGGGTLVVGGGSFWGDWGGVCTGVGFQRSYAVIV